MDGSTASRVTVLMECGVHAVVCCAGRSVQVPDSGAG